MKLDRKQVLNSLHQICVFRDDRSSNVASDLLKHFQLLLCISWMDFDETWQEAMPSIKFVFFVLIVHPRWPPWPLIGWNIFRLLLHNCWILTKLDRRQVHNLLFQACVFMPKRNKRRLPWPLISCSVFQFAATTEWILTKLDRKSSTWHGIICNDYQCLAY